MEDYGLRLWRYQQQSGNPDIQPESNRKQHRDEVRLSIFKERLRKTFRFQNPNRVLRRAVEPSQLPQRIAAALLLTGQRATAAHYKITCVPPTTTRALLQVYWLVGGLRHTPDGWLPPVERLHIATVMLHHLAAVLHQRIDNGLVPSTKYTETNASITLRHSNGRHREA